MHLITNKHTYLMKNMPSIYRYKYIAIERLLKFLSKMCNFHYNSYILKK